MNLTIPLAAVAALALASGAAAETAQPKGDSAKGKTIFGSQCMLCHSVAAGQEGAAPNLAGVVGRKAASDPGFPAYSKALKASGLTWTAANVNKFLSGPAKLVPGTNMPITLSNPADRANVVAYLASTKGSH